MGGATKPPLPDSRPGGAGIEDSGLLLRELRSLVPFPLIDDGGWCRLLARANGLPATGLCLEFRLGEPAANADLFVVLTPGSAAERAYIRRGQEAQPDSFQWRLARHLAETGGAAGPLATILEYDVTYLPSGLMPYPAVFRGLWRRAAREKGFRDPRSAGHLAFALAEAVGRTADEEEVAVLRSLVAALPPRGRPIWIGAMPAREPRMLRAQVLGIGAAGLVDSLKQVGWPGSTDSILAVLDVIKGHSVGIGILLDLAAGGLLPRLGLEVYPPTEGQSGELDAGGAATSSSFWRALLTSLEEAGWSLPEKSRGLLAFRGREHVIGDGIFEVRKEINHVKISIEEGEAPAAKAYGRMLFRPVGP